MSTLALLQKLHGLLGALAVASCLHPAVTLRPGKRPNRRQRLSAELAAGAAVLTILLGWWIYADYRFEVRPYLLAHHPAVHDLWFEIKEAVGYFALCAAIAGALLLHFGAPVTATRRGARLLYGLAFGGGLVAGILGMIVASYKDFG